MRQISQTAMEGFRIVAGGFTPRSARIIYTVHLIHFQVARRRPGHECPGYKAQAIPGCFDRSPLILNDVF